MKKEIKKDIPKNKKEETPKEVVSDNVDNEKEIREVIVERKTGFNYIEVIIIMIITLILGGVIGSFVTYIGKEKNDEKIESGVVSKQFSEFISTYENIMDDYYEDINQEELLEAGIKGMIDYLGDDYSVFLDGEQSDDFNQQVEGKYTGIGVEIVMNEKGEVSISRVFAGSPAEESGLQSGDIFVKVGDEDVVGKNSSEISSMIKNSKSDKVVITVLRGDTEKSFTLKLKEVQIESVTSKVFEKNSSKVGYIGIDVFAANTYEQFEKQLLKLEGENINSLIIDVRDNSGGYLNSVTSIASLFLNKNKIVYQLDTKGIIEPIYSLKKSNRKYSIVVLINQNSASASEILAAALKESYGAKVVGVNTFGKGTVQKAYQLESGATVKYTIQKWLTPDGNWINEVGVEPTDKVELADTYYTNPIDDNDNQLQKAIELLSE